MYRQSLSRSTNHPKPTVGQSTHRWFLLFSFFRSDARRVDIDNLQKAALDGLQLVLFADDSQILNISAWKRISSKNPRLDVTIQEIIDFWK